MRLIRNCVVLSSILSLSSVVTSSSQPEESLRAIYAENDDREGSTVTFTSKSDEEKAWEAKRQERLARGCIYESENDYEACETYQESGSSRRRRALRMFVNPARRRLQEEGDADGDGKYDANSEGSMDGGAPPSEGEDCVATNCAEEMTACTADADCAYVLDRDNQCMEAETPSADCVTKMTAASVLLQAGQKCAMEKCAPEGSADDDVKRNDGSYDSGDQGAQSSDCNNYNCDHNIHCIRSDSNDGYCSDDNTFVPCRDCEKCANSKVCVDELFFCNELSEAEKAALPVRHPCVAEECSVNRASKDCTATLFDHCCDPELESCHRTEESTCSAAGCSRFSDPNNYVEVNYEKAKCPFADAASTCESDACSGDGMFRDIIDLFGGGSNQGCQGDYCFEAVYLAACPAVMEGNDSMAHDNGDGHHGEHNGTIASNSTSARRRRRERRLTSVFHKSWIHPIRRKLQQTGPTSPPPGDATEEGKPPCLQEKCKSFDDACMADETCGYFLDNCMDGEKPADCDAKGVEAASLIEPLMGCFVAECNPAGQQEGGEPCAMEMCSDEMETCKADADCGYSLDNCMGDAAEDSAYPTDCETRMEASMDLLSPASSCYYEKCMGNDTHSNTTTMEPQDPDMCISEKCAYEKEACLAVDDCAYVMDNCTGDGDDMPADCAAKMQQQQDLFVPIRECYMQNCEMQSGGGSDEVGCVQAKCDDQFKACGSDMDCGYVLQYCMGSSPAADCQETMQAAATLLQPAMECYNANCSSQPSSDGGESVDQCIGRECSDVMGACMQDENCGYVLQQCTNGQGPEDCEAKKESAKDLFGAAEGCYVEKCAHLENNGGGSESSEECAMNKCSTEVQSCMGNTDCSYVLQQCMDGDGPEDCDAKMDSAKDLVEPVKTCYEANCSHLEGDKEGDDGGFECAQHECTDFMNACLEHGDCKFVMDHCMDGEADPSDGCGEKMEAAKDTLGPLMGCYEEKCASREVDEGFRQILEQARKCFGDSCSDSWDACQMDSSCAPALNQLLNCPDNNCAEPLMGANLGNTNFAAAINCVQTECSVGHDGGGGDERRMCAETLVSYCDANPLDAGCQDSCPYQCVGENCPCSSDQCNAVFSATRCARDKGICGLFKEKLTQAYMAQGHYQPNNEWDRVQQASFLLPRPNGSLVMSSELMELQEKCNNASTDLGSNIAACMVPSIAHCNKNEWDNGCRDLSVCGDGYVSWSERCDDGNKDDYDGCPSWCHPKEGYICPDQGEPCEKCVRDRRAEYGDQNVCQFCANERVANMTSPCLHPACTNIQGYTEAKACDDHVETYCDAMKTAGLRDLGCDKYEKKARMYNIPTIVNKCEYKIKSLNLNAKSISKVKVAVFTCTFDDPHGVTENTTPMFRSAHPYMNMDDDYKKELDPSVIKILDAMYATRKDALIPLSKLRLDDFYSYFHPGLVHQKNPIWIHNNIARLEINFEDQPDPPRYDEYGNLNCHYNGESRDMTVLPPVKEPMKMALKAYLAKMRWEAINYESDDKEEFKDFDIGMIDTGGPEDLMNSTIVFGMVLSTTYKQNSGNGQSEERENKEYMCKNWYNIDWQKIEENPDCTTVEDNIKSGKSRIIFGNSLYQAGCTDDQCDLKVDHCRRVGLTPQKLNVNAEDYKKTADTVITEVDAMLNSTSWADLVEKFVRVSAAASTRSYDDAMELFNQLVIKGKKTKFMKDVPDYCPHYYHNSDGTENEDWKADPCCNWELRQYQCCAPQDVPNGEVDIVTAISRPQISTYCQGYTAEVENLLQDVLINVNLASKCAEDIEASVSVNVWDETWKVKDTCERKMWDAGQTECEKDEDCSHCSQSTCYIESGTSGKCTVPYDDAESCMLECFEIEMDPELVRYLREEWGVSAAAEASVFKEAFVEKMTEPACSGPKAWESDIGYNGYQWECNTTCTSKHICDDYDYQNHLQEVKRANGNNWDWINFGDNDTCIEYGGTPGEWSQCHFDDLDAPCKKESECYNECNKVNMQPGCEELGGTWIPNQDNGGNGGGGRCCPPDAHVYMKNGQMSCSWAPEGSPSSWEVQTQTCCTANNGSWAIVNENGQCCFGKWTTNKHNEQEHTYCQEDVWGWDMSECYDECNELRGDCQDCRIDRQDCCGEVYKTANQTACLSYEQCTDGSIWEGSGKTCDDPTPFCAQCHGSHCYRAGEPSACFYSDFYNQASCEALGSDVAVWDQNRWRCKVAGSDGMSGWECFTPGPTICPNPYDFPHQYQGIDEEKPKYQWGQRSCQKGCYLPNLEEDACRSYSNTYWDSWSGAANGTGVCRGHANAVGACEAMNGVFVPYRIGFDTGRFTTEEQCNEGQCRGNLGWGGWSREQCETSSKYSCSRSCNTCQSHTYPYSQNGYGACFSMNTTTCSMEGQLTPCLFSNIEEEDCDDDHEKDVVWKSCSEYSSQSTCNNDYSTDKIAETLSCSWNWGQCETQETCEAVGECDDWDNQRQECEDAGWTHGDTCWASYTEEEFDDKSNSTISTYKYDSCNMCRQKDGVCVTPRPDNQGCGDGKWHRLGCKVFGVSSEAQCNGVTDGTWYTRATTKEECHAVKGCKEVGRWGLSDLPPSECTKCGGTLEPRYTWYGGVWSKPKVRDLTWKSEGAIMAPANEWKPAIANYRVQRELLIPIVRRFAKKKQTQALLMYNVFSEALKTLACACGNGPNENCFGSTEGSISGVSKAFCGLETPISAACGTAVVKKDCETYGDGRRLLEKTSRRLEGSSVDGESMTMTWKHFTAGVYTDCYEPHSSEADRTDLNPLAIKNNAGVVYGQLLGDGKGMSTSGDFTSVELCLDLRTDIRVWDSKFTVIDIGVKDESTGKIVPMMNSDWTVKTTVKVCFLATADGVYFPIQRVDATLATVEAVAKDAGCSANSLQAYDGSSSSCVCKCGFSGTTCSEGCLNSCSNSGTCTDGTCVCLATRTGLDCGEYNCPLGAANGKKCSAQGTCNEDATCTCFDNYKGDDCSILNHAEQNITAPDSYAALDLPDIEEEEGPSTPSPTLPTYTAAPTTEAPATDAPTDAPTTRAPPVTPPPTRAPEAPPATSKPRVAAYSPPPVPAPASTCMADNCESFMDECIANPAFDTCACMPGLLDCAANLCADDQDAVMEECTALAESATTCTMVCEPKAFPSDAEAELEMSAKVVVEIAGVSADVFMANMVDAFKQAISDPLPTTEPEDIQDVIASEKARRRLIARNLQAGGIKVDFTIIVDDPNELVETQNQLLDAVEASAAEDGEGGGAATPSLFAQAMAARGVIDDPAQLTVKESKTEVKVLKASSATKYEEARKTEDFMSQYGAFIFGGAGAAAVLLLVVIYCCCCKKGGK